jgi:hypothetical protein
MLACNRLRIDPGNGSPAVDYRIENGCVESRTLETDAAKSTLAIEKQWQRLTPEATNLPCNGGYGCCIMATLQNGVHRLIRACNQDGSASNNPVLEGSNRTVA